MATVGCRCLAMDAQGFGQSDGARGYFESFQEVKEDFVTFVRTKWAEVRAGKTCVDVMFFNTQS